MRRLQLVHPWTLFFLCALTVLSLAQNATNVKPPTLRLTGSTTLYPVVEQWQRSLGSEFTWLKKEQMRTGSGTGETNVCLPSNHPNKVDIGTMSRDWKTSVAQLLDDGYTWECKTPVNGTKVRVTQLVIGLDGLAVVVAKKSPGENCLLQMGALTTAQLRWMFSNLNNSQLALNGVNVRSVAPNDDGDNIKEWSDLNAQCEHVPINIYGPGLVSGTREFFMSSVLTAPASQGETLPNCAPATNNPLQTMTAEADIAATLRNSTARPNNCYVASEADDVEQVMQWVMLDPFSIGYLGLAWYNDLQNKLTAAPIADDAKLGISDTKEAKVAPTTYSIMDGSYARFRRYLYMQVDNNAWNVVRPFLAYGFSPAGQSDVAQVGYVLMNSALLAKMKIRITQGGNPSADYVPVPPATCASGTEIKSTPYVNTYGTPKVAYTCTKCVVGFSKRENTATPCSPCSPGSFANASGQSTCSFCASGFFSLSQAVNCTSCPINWVAPMPGQGSCSKCDDGMYTDKLGSSACLRCEVGKYRNSTLLGCTICPADMDTPYQGSTKREDCLCQPGTYHETGVLAGTIKEGPCLPCPEGMVCDRGSKYDNIALWTLETASQVPIPTVKEGYYSLKSDPLSIYRCWGTSPSGGCSGGGPEQCAGGRVGLVCALCPEGRALKDNVCSECSGESRAFTVVIPIASVIFVMICYYLSNSRLTVNANISLAHSIIFGMLITIFQVLSTYKDLGIKWPTALSNLFTSLSFFIGSPKVLSYECMLGQQAAKQYAIRCSLPVIFVGIVAVLYLSSKLVALALNKIHLGWELNKTMNCVGQVLQAVFIGLATITVVPLQCYSHPNGMSSLTKFPELLCWQSDHKPLLVLAALVAVFFVIPFYALCIWASVSVVRHVHADGAENKVVRYRFLLYRFRPDRWWWSNVFNTRQLLLAFASALPSDMPHGQAIYVAATLTIYAIVNAHYWPWKTTEFNFFDTAVSALLTLVVVSATAFLPEDNGGLEGYTVFIVILLVFLAGASSMMYFLFIYYICRQGTIWGSFGTEKVNGHTAEEISDAWMEAILMCRELGQEHILEGIKAMNKFDRQALLQAMAAWQATHPECFHGTLSVMRLMGIANTRSSFAVKSARRVRTTTAGNASHASTASTPGSASGQLASEPRPAGAGAQESDFIEPAVRSAIPVSAFI